ncbi:TRAP transporter small permease [Aidingimonas lacisalsi]|uniref:TRAP transporter small permease n=1 Tax=Aidingimonas lacisalsi TaxID=2604086 RepID=UPI0011D245B2|nr:TRAP transporter small permease [Aidingimonas lacisalsi]
MVERFLRVESHLTRLALFVAVLMLVLSVVTGFYQVLTRFVFNAPSTWSEVMARSTMIWCVFLAMAPCFRGGYMMAVEIIYKLVPARALMLVESFIGLACLIVLVILFYFGIAMTVRVSGQTLSGLGISIAWAYAAIPVGAGFSLIALCARLLAQVTGRETIGPQRDEAEESVTSDTTADSQKERRARS